MVELWNSADALRGLLVYLRWAAGIMAILSALAGITVVVVNNRVDRLTIIRNRARELSEASWSPESRRDLTVALKGYADRDANVKILFSRADQRQTADLLVSVFSLAGWKADLTNVPLGTWLFDSGYFDGVEVRGYNQQLVDAVSNALTAAGLSGVVSRVDPLKVPTTNPKWAWANQRIKITLGHAEPDQVRNSLLGRLDEMLRNAELPHSGLSSPQAKPTPESDAGPTEYFPIKDGRYLRMTLPAGTSLTSDQRRIAAALIEIYEVEVDPRW